MRDENRSKAERSGKPLIEKSEVARSRDIVSHLTLALLSTVSSRLISSIRTALVEYQLHGMIQTRRLLTHLKSEYLPCRQL
jgi:hypothetical protein